jgi:hypothetical protein
VVRQIVQAGIVAFIFLATLYTGTAGAHGKVEMEDDSCMRRIGENMIHLSVYQPQVDIEGHYCSDIPQVGNAVLVIDLVDPALREMPIGIKVIRGGNEEDGEVIADMRPALYEDGVINTQKMLEQGKHILVVTADGLPPLSYKYNLRVEMINYAEVFRASIGPLVGILLTTILGYKIMRSRRFKDWLASKRGKQTSDNDTSGGKTSSNKTVGNKTASRKTTSSSEASNNDAGSTKTSNEQTSNNETSSNETSENKTSSSETGSGNKTSK